MPRKKADWPAIEADYRAGQLSLRHLAAKHSVSESTIRSRAKRLGWQRDLRSRVRWETKQRLDDQPIPDANDRQGPADTDDEDRAVAQAVNANVAVISRHKRLLERQIQSHSKLTESVANALEHGEVPAFLGLRESMADMTLKLARAAQTLFDCERRAYRIDEGDGDKGDYETRLKAVIEQHPEVGE